MVLPNDILISEFHSLLKEGKKVRFTPTGVSMRPFIEGGRDRVVLVLPSDLKRGDIVLAHLPDRYVLHRIIAREGDQLTLMGDGNIRGVEYASCADVIAVVAEIRSPHNRRKIISRGRLWHFLLPVRPCLLKIYRHLPRIW